MMRDRYVITAFVLGFLFALVVVIVSASLSGCWCLICEQSEPIPVYSETQDNPICRNETMEGGFTFKINEPNVYCLVNETLTQKAIESDYPYTIYTCVKEVCE